MMMVLEVIMESDMIKMSHTWSIPPEPSMIITPEQSLCCAVQRQWIYTPAILDLKGSSPNARKVMD